MWEHMEIKVFTADDKMAFDWMVNIPREIKDAFVSIINGEREPKFKVKKEFYHKNDGIVYCKMLEGKDAGDEYKLFRIRGWGMLTGVGGYNLDAETAAQVQDDFMEYCINQLNG
jgi:hypothetical protein